MPRPKQIVKAHLVRWAQEAWNKLQGKGEIKEKILEAYDNDVLVKKLAGISGIPESTIYGWIEARKKKEAESHAQT